MTASIFVIMLSCPVLLSSLYRRVHATSEWQSTGTTPNHMPLRSVRRWAMHFTPQNRRVFLIPSPPHSTFHGGLTEIETIYRADQVLLLNHRGSLNCRCTRVSR